MNKSHSYLSYFSIILAAVLWGTMCVFVKGLQAFGLDSFRIAFLRSLVSLIFISCLVLFKDKSLFKIHLRDIWMFIGSGIISYFLFNICYFNSIQEVGAAIASALLYTSPLFVTIMSCILFGERMTKKKVLCLILAVSGCALVSGIASGNIESLPVGGLLMGIASGFTYALYSIFSTYALRKYEPLTVTFYTFLFGTVAASVIGSPIETFKTVATPDGILWAISLGIIGGALPYFFYTLGLSRVKPSHAAVLATVEPVVASLIGIFFFSEPSDEFTVIGIITIIGASVLLNIKAKKEK